MGMFDYITYEADCSNCGQPLSDFQSKGADCVLAKLTPAQLIEKAGSANAHFYTSCNNCGTWCKYKVMPATGVRVVEITKLKGGSK